MLFTSLLLEREYIYFVLMDQSPKPVQYVIM
jgi:hypothetical protein